MKNQVTLDKSGWLSLEQQVQDAGNSIDDVIHFLQTVAPDNKELIQKLNRMSPSNPSSEMADILRNFDKKIKHGQTAKK